MRLPLDHLLQDRMKVPTVKSANGIGLLNLLRESGPMSRADLAKRSHLSKPTVSAQVDGLIEKNLVKEIGPGQSTAKGGKTPTLVAFNSDSGRIIAVEIDSARIHVVMTDLEGVRHSEVRIRPLRTNDANSVLEQVEDGIRRLLSAQPRIGKKVRLISVAASGRVDADQGIVIQSGNVFNWQMVPVRGRLERIFGFPVFVDNDVRMAALAEMHQGSTKGEKNFILLRLSTGIGCGVVIGGALYHGHRWMAGEVAHFVVGPLLDTQPSPRGQLESIVAADCIAARVSSALPSSVVLTRLVKKHGEIPGLLLAAAKRDSVSRLLLDEVISALGLVIVHLFAAYDPTLIVLQGSLVEALIKDLQRIVERALPWPVRLAKAEAGDDAVLNGTIMAGRAKAYEQISRGINAS